MSKHDWLMGAALTGLLLGLSLPGQAQSQPVSLPFSYGRWSGPIRQLANRSQSTSDITRGSVSQEIRGGERYESVDHEFAGAAGERVFLEINTSGFDAQIRLIGPNGETVAQASTQETRMPFATLRADLPSYGQYQVVVSTLEPSSAGSYGLSWAIIHDFAIVQSAGNVPPELINGSLSQTSRTLDDGSYFEIHTFEGVEREALLIEMESTDFQPALVLINPAGEIMAVDRDRSSEDNAEMLVILPTSGTYQILAQSLQPRQTGPYRLSWRAPDANELQQIQLSSDFPADAYAQGQRNLTGFLPSEQASEAFFQDSFNAVIPLMEEELMTARLRLGDRHPEVAESLNGLATLYLMQNRYADAEPLFLEALDIYQAQPTGYAAQQAMVLDSLGAIAVQREQLGQAIDFYEEALAILQADPGDRADLIPLLATNLAFARQAQGRDGAEPNLPTATNDPTSETEALLAQTVARAREGDDPFDLAVKIETLASYYVTQQRYDAAETLYREALTIYQEQYPDAAIESPQVSTSLNNIALIYQTQGRYAEAEALYTQALNNYDRYITSISTIGDNGYTTPQIQALAASQRIYMVPMFYNLAGLYRAQGDVSQAISTLREGIAIEEVSLDISLANLGNSDRIAHVAKLANTLNYVVSLHLDTAPNSTPAAQFALTNLLRRKGRVLEAGVRAQEILRQRGTPEDLDLLAQLMRGQQELANLTTQRPANLSDREYQTRLTRLRSEVNQVEAAIARRSADLSLAGQPVELPVIQQQIPDHGVLIEFIRYRPFDPTQPLGDRFNEANLTAAGSNNFSAPRYAAYLLFPDGRIVARDLGDAATIDAAVQDFVGILQNPATNLSATAGSDAVTEITQNIATLVFGAIAPDLAAVEHLLISPDGQLNLLPFEALQTEAGGDYLVQQYQISYLNSGRDLLKFDAVEPSQNPALILADPDYETAANLPSSDVAAGSGTRADSRAADFRQLQFTRLPGTAAEAEAIRPFLPNARVLTTDQATENAVKQVQAPRILHIATHGFFLTDVEPPALAGRGIGVVASDGTLPSTTLPRASVDVENPLLRSGLALAGFNRRRSGSEDGVFTALEASSLNLLGTQLVVLSACDTGLGDIANGEGVYGLRRAFAIAGAESQLMSLWQVSDFGTQNLMAQYYEKLAAGMGRSAALRAVQLEMLASGGEYSHPYYWAAFILAGDWRSL